MNPQLPGKPRSTGRRIPPRHSAGGRRAIALAAALTVAAGGACAALGADLVGADHATAVSTALRPGLGYRVPGGGLVGYYLSHGTKVYCLDPGKASPARIALHPAARYPGLGAAVTAELSYALTRWGDAKTAAQAATESQVLNTLAGNTGAVRSRARAIPTRLRARVRARVRAARTLRGPYTVRVGLPKALLPGQHATGTAVVLSAAGRRVPHVGLFLRHSSNSTATDWVRSSAKGVARFDYAATDIGPIGIRASALALPSARILVSRPKPGRQHLVSWGLRRRASGVATSSARPAAFTTSYSCTSTCSGRPVVSLRACAPRGALASRLRYRVGSRPVLVRYRANSAHRCRSIRIRARDGDRIGATWQFRTVSGWSHQVRAAGSIVVDCPAVPTVAALLRYDCTRARVLIALSDPGLHGGWRPLVNNGRHRLVLTVGGARSARIYAVPGQRAEFRAGADCSSPVTYTMRAGVQRADGSYNYGPQASVTTPGGTLTRSA